MAKVSMKRHERAKQLVMFFEAAGIGPWGGWGAGAVLQGGVQAQGHRQRQGRVVLVDEHRTSRVSSAVNGQLPLARRILTQPPCSQGTPQPAVSEPEPSTIPQAKRSKRTKVEHAAEPTQPTKGKGKGKAAQRSPPAPQPGRWLDRDCNAALESRWRSLENNAQRKAQMPPASQLPPLSSSHVGVHSAEAPVVGPSPSSEDDAQGMYRMQTQKLSHVAVMAGLSPAATRMLMQIPRRSCHLTHPPSRASTSEWREQDWSGQSGSRDGTACSAPHPGEASPQLGPSLSGLADLLQSLKASPAGGPGTAPSQGPWPSTRPPAFSCSGAMTTHNTQSKLCGHKPAPQRPLTNASLAPAAAEAGCYPRSPSRLSRSRSIRPATAHLSGRMDPAVSSAMLLHSRAQLPVVATAAHSFSLAPAKTQRVSWASSRVSDSNSTLRGACPEPPLPWPAECWHATSAREIVVQSPRASEHPSLAGRGQSPPWHSAPSHLQAPCDSPTQVPTAQVVVPAGQTGRQGGQPLNDPEQQPAGQRLAHSSASLVVPKGGQQGHRGDSRCGRHAGRHPLLALARLMVPRCMQGSSVIEPVHVDAASSPSHSSSHVSHLKG
ncbi:hypothetical protein QJQ45_010157 [Haematococcus lacustris]|nr:hypothetical protein QJQ45_010157 [Haematococcus lacustris]